MKKILYRGIFPILLLYITNNFHLKAVTHDPFDYRLMAFFDYEIQYQDISVAMCRGSDPNPIDAVDINDHLVMCLAVADEWGGR